MTWNNVLLVTTLNTQNVTFTNKSSLSPECVTSILLTPSSQTANVIISRSGIYQWHKSYQCLDQSNLSQSHYVCLETTPTLLGSRPSHMDPQDPPPLQPIPLSYSYVLIAGHASVKISSRDLSVIPRETTVEIRDT
jgi:hypothetical protein